MSTTTLFMMLLIGSVGTTTYTSRTFNDPGGTDIVTYPNSLFSGNEIEFVMRLSPNLRMRTSFPVMNEIEMCVKGEPEYQGCGTEAARGRWFTANARANLQGMRDALRALNDAPAMDGLKQVVEYERQVQAFYLDINEVRLDFKLSGDLSLLEKPLNTVDPRLKCSESLAAVRRATTQKAANEVVRMDWYNCMNANFRTKIGPYPADAWRSFVLRTGIKEKYVPLEE